jgi:hypothetical protein
MAYLFIDTEFSDFINMDLLSIGIVSEDGKHEFYAEINDSTPEYRSQFVNEVVIPLMEPAKFARPYKRVAADLCEWFAALPGDSHIMIVDYAGDWQLLGELLSATSVVQPKKLSANYLSLAFEDMIIERGGNVVDSIGKAAGRRLLIEQENYFIIDPRRHHALVDAKANRHGWVKAYEYAMKGSTV